jgi:hypothetical protein
MSDAFQEADDATAIHALAGEILRMIKVSRGFGWIDQIP